MLLRGNWKSLFGRWIADFIFWRELIQYNRVCACCLGGVEGCGLDRCIPDGGDGGGLPHSADPGFDKSGGDRVCLEHVSRWRQTWRVRVCTWLFKCHFYTSLIYSDYFHHTYDCFQLWYWPTKASHFLDTFRGRDFYLAGYLWGKPVYYSEMHFLQDREACTLVSEHYWVYAILHVMYHEFPLNWPQILLPMRTNLSSWYKTLH